LDFSFSSRNTLEPTCSDLYCATGLEETAAADARRCVGRPLVRAPMNSQVKPRLFGSLLLRCRAVPLTASRRRFFNRLLCIVLIGLFPFFCPALYRLP
ncbi:hypothetical protein, partial [Deinococcus soli (ex Cha et al. 2016)]|uniref:hypothetical protein n=1 Tax=Deinococcus soli (ex Cha et al. 2016) TaxID=1309411 RepID=UPI001E50EEE3